MNLEETILDQFLEGNPNKYRDDTIDRVRALVEYEIEKPDFAKPIRRFLQTIDDFLLYQDLHPEWIGKTANELKEFKDGKKFYDVLTDFICSISEDPEQRDSIRSQFIKSDRYEWQSFGTIDDWQNYYDDHFAGKTADQLKKGEDVHGKRFYEAFTRWIKDQSDNPKTRRTFREKLFEPIKIKTTWSEFTEFKHWKDHYDSHFAGKSSGEIQETNEGSAFIDRFYVWVRGQSKNKKVRQKLRDDLFDLRMRTYFSFSNVLEWKNHHDKHFEGKNVYQLQHGSKEEKGFYRCFDNWVCRKYEDEGSREKIRAVVFETKYIDWSVLKNFGDWKNYYNDHFEGKSCGEIINIPGGEAFYGAFLRWLNKRHSNSTVKAMLRSRLIPKDNGSAQYDFGKGEIEFGSKAERVIGILLNKYGLIKNFEEGENLHVRTNTNGRHNLDFLVGNTFIEFHPVSRRDKKMGRGTPEAVGRYRLQHITKPEYDNTWFWHIWAVNDLYDIINDSAVDPLMNKRYKGLTYEQFREHVSEAYEKAREYDSKIVAMPKSGKKVA